MVRDWASKHLVMGEDGFARPHPEELQAISGCSGRERNVFLSGMATAEMPVHQTFTLASVRNTNYIYSFPPKEEGMF